MMFCRSNMQGKGVQEEQLEATVAYCMNQARQFIAFLMSNDVSTTCSVCSACKRDKKGTSVPACNCNHPG